MANHVYLLLGSNEGNRTENLRKALLLIGEKAGKVCKTSSVYETAPWGKTDQAAFLNQAACVESLLSPSRILAVLKAIEKEVGRVNAEKWGPRVMDIDILLYDDEIIHEADLIIPHPYLPERRFALVPLAEIAASLVHPVLHTTVSELLAMCADTSPVTLYSPV